MWFSDYGRRWSDVTRFSRQLDISRLDYSFMEYRDMPITERWLDDTKTTLLAEYIGAYTREDNQKSFEKRKMLCAEVDYPIGVIEDQSRGYYVKHLNAPAPIDSGSIYVGVQAFSHRSHIYRNRIAITICIPYKLGDGDTGGYHAK
jgi:hypothetical protein